MSHSQRIIEKNLYPVWNAEFVVSKDKNTDGNMLGFPIQNKKLLNFQHFNVLSAFDVKLNLDKIDRLGIHTYFDGSNTIDQIVNMVLSKNEDATESVVLETITKMERMGIISVIE